jgi:REP element-mobilizing transposase RayT
VKLVLSQISRGASERVFSILAYCFMPDHLHLLIHGELERANCKSFISLAKQYSGFHYKRQFLGCLWQRYIYERTLREDEQTVRVARYIVENPVRAMLVACAMKLPVCRIIDLRRKRPAGIRRARVRLKPEAGHNVLSSSPAKGGHYTHLRISALDPGRITY